MVFILSSDLCEKVHCQCLTKWPSVSYLHACFKPNCQALFPWGGYYNQTSFTGTSAHRPVPRSLGNTRTPELAGLPLWQKWKSLEKQWHLSHVLNVNLLSSVKRTECQWRSVVVAGSTCNSRSASLALIWQVSGFGKLGLDSAKIESTPFVGLLLLVESFLFTVHNPLLWLLKHSTVTSKLAG